jgi:hypothetical protein
MSVNANTFVTVSPVISTLSGSKYPISAARRREGGFVRGFAKGFAGGVGAILEDGVNMGRGLN